MKIRRFMLVMLSISAMLVACGDDAAVTDGAALIPANGAAEGWIAANGVTLPPAIGLDEYPADPDTKPSIGSGGNVANGASVVQNASVGVRVTLPPGLVVKAVQYQLTNISMEVLLVGGTNAALYALTNEAGTLYYSGSVQCPAATNFLIVLVNALSPPQKLFKTDWFLVVQAGGNAVLYDANGATGGSVPRDWRLYWKDELVPVATNSGSLVRTEQAFAGWNTRADGVGSNMAPGSMFLMGEAPVTLYARWDAAADVTPPIWTAVPVLVGAPGQTTAVIGFTINETGVVYCLVLADGAAAPTAAVVGAASNNVAAAAGVPGSINLSGLTAGTAYDVYVVARDMAGNLQAAPVKVDLSMAVPPAIAGDNQVTIKWPVVGGATGYKIYLDTDSGFAGAVCYNDIVGTISGTSTTIGGLANGTAYYFWVAAIVGGVEQPELYIGTATPSDAVLSTVVSGIMPGDNAIEVDPVAVVSIPFNRPLAAATVSASSVTAAVDGVPVAVNVSLVGGGTTINVAPVGGTWGQGKSVIVRVSSTVTSSDGLLSLVGGSGFSFSTLLTGGMEAWWKFNNDLTDASGNGWHISVNNGVTFNTSELKEGVSSAYFNGAANLFLTNTGFDLGNEFTITCWIKIPLLESSLKTILANGGGGNPVAGFKLCVNKWMELNKSITLEAGNGMEGGKWSSPDNFVQEGNWYHFAYSINKATGAVRIHFNGESAAIELSDGASLSMDWTGMKTTGPFTFGSFIDGQYHFTGYIDDMRVYKRSLTDAEILNLAR